jgi:hypothetical protein
MTQASNLAKGGSNFNTTGNLSLTTGVTGTLPVANGGTGGTTSTGSGALVLATSPTLVTPALGTPSSGTLTNCTFPTLNQNTTGTAAGLSATLAVASGGTGLTTTPANGALDIGNGTGFTRTTLTAGTGISVTNASGSITIATSGSSGVTSVATGNGLSGGTITSTGTLVVACPTFNTVGSYCMVVQNGNFTDATWSLTAGGNYGVGSGIGGVQAATISQNNGSSCSTDYTAGQISGTWKWMGAGYGTVYWQISQVSVACRVS